jgi:hypothetical protein
MLEYRAQELGYYANLENQTCTKCPALYNDCELVEDKIECLSCAHFAFKNEGICKCYDTDNQVDEKTCPESWSDDLENNFSNFTCHTLTYAERSLKTAFYIESVTYSSSLLISPFISGIEAAWAMMNTIQILLFIGIINVNLPISLRVSLKAQKSYLLGYDISQGISDRSLKPFSVAYEFKYKSSAYLSNIGKPLFHLSCIIISSIVISSLSKILRGKI